MSAINKIPRGLKVLIVITLLALLVWKFAIGFYFLPGIVVAVLITLMVIFLVYRKPRGTLKKEKTLKTIKSKSDSDNIEFESTDDTQELINSENLAVDSEFENDPDSNSAIIKPFPRSKSGYVQNKTENKPRATDVAAKYFDMAKSAETRNISGDWRPSVKKTEPVVKPPVSDKTETPSVPDSIIKDENTQSDDIVNSSEPPLPLIEDESTLTLEEKNILVNAVWYRCENPFCKYTSFLGVHHILDEKDGGTNKLDNLIVLCPFCHDLAHKKEIPEEEMKEWIKNREEGFKFKLEWHH